MLYIVPTPIGNLEDMTLRALRVLREADLIAAEDTRKTVALLNHFEIKKPLVSYYEHNKRRHGELLLGRLREGASIALVSDAGCPGICDPGADLIKEALAEGMEICVLPGACAGITALIASGLDTQSFAFEGFLPREKAQRKKRLQALAQESRTLIFYEAPHRIAETLRQIYEAFGEREAALCRELTKKFEEIERGSLSALVAEYAEREPKGEFVLVIAGAEPAELKLPSTEELLAAMKELLAGGVSRKQAARQLALQYGLSVKELYDMSLPND